MNRAALKRSLDVYYRDRARTARMDRLNAQVVRDGCLAFDIGAHVGDRTASFRRLGARVVAVEPQPRVFRALRLIHHRDPGVTLRNMAVGDTAGEVTFHINSANPTVSTASADLLRAAPHAAAWHRETWDSTLQVPVTTLDAMIQEHGVPDFTKIDVEGFEADVLAGLSQALPVLSFEITTLQRAIGIACVARLGALGSYVFNLSLGEDHAFQYDTWLGPDAMIQVLKMLPDAANSGDVYAKRV